MPTLIAGVVAVVLLYLAAADVSRGQSGRAGARDQDRRRRRGAGGRGLYRHAGRTGGGDPARHFRRRAARLVAVRADRASAISAGCSAAARKRSPGQTSQVRSQFLDMTLDHDSGELTGQIVAGPNAGRSLDEFDLPQLLAMMPASTPRAWRYLKAIWTAGFPPGVRTRRATRQGGRAARRRAAK